MNALTVKIGSDISELRTGMAKAQDLVKGFQGTIESVAGSIGIAFGVQQVGSFALELTKLAGQVDGVKQAFDKLQGSAQVLSDLKTATRGTVSEFDLMKAAVQASNFKIPIEQLGSLFNFAYERAKATGQSVDYLVNSIVVGIGRKSPLILDNLGISAVELKDRLKGVSTEAATVGDVAKAVGAIASDAMAQMGASAETAAEKVAQIGAKWDDIKAKFGSIIADKVTKGPDGLLNNISNQLTVWQSNQFSFWQKLLGSAKEYQDMVNQINQSADAAATRNVQNSQGLTLSTKDPFAAIRAKYANAGTQDTGLAGALRRRNSASSGLPTSDIEGQSVNPSFLRDLGSDLDGLQKKVDGFNMDNLRQQWEQSAEATKNLGAAVSQLGDAVGQGLGAAISGTVSFGQAMAQMASQVVASLERMALAYMIENNAKFGLPGIALAAIGFGAIKSLFAKIGSGGGGSGSVPATTSQRATAPVYQERLVTNISGQNLAVVLQRYQDSNSYTRPVGG
jgi:hypothetical protein